MCAEHEKLIEQILEEEEELITGHRRHIDDVVDLVKQEMALLNDVDKPGSDVVTYVASLDRLLTQKIQMIIGMRKQLIDFHTHLMTEENMSKLYQQQQAAQDTTTGGATADNFADDLLMENNNFDEDDNQYSQQQQYDYSQSQQQQQVYNSQAGYN